MLKCSFSQTQLGSSPLSPLGVIPDLTTNLHLNLLGDGMILFLFFGQEFLNAEGLVRRHGKEDLGTLTMMAE